MLTTLKKRSWSITAIRFAGLLSAVLVTTGIAATQKNAQKPPLSLDSSLQITEKNSSTGRWKLVLQEKERGYIREIGIFLPERVRSVIEEKTQLLSDYSIPELDPYFGEVDKEDGCPRSLIPPPANLDRKVGTGKIIHGYAGADGTFGICEPSGKSQKIQVVLLQCRPHSPVYEARIYYSLKENWKYAPLVRCSL